MCQDCIITTRPNFKEFDGYQNLPEEYKNLLNIFSLAEDPKSLPESKNPLLHSLYDNCDVTKWLLKNFDTRVFGCNPQHIFKTIGVDTIIHHQVFSTYKNEKNIYDYMKKMEILRLMLDKKEFNIDVNGKDQATKTLLFRASDSGCLDIVNLLEKYGADPNITEDLDKITPLMGALEHNYYEIAEKLIKMGADPNAKTRYGVQAKDFTRKRSFYEFNSQILRKYF